MPFEESPQTKRVITTALRDRRVVVVMMMMTVMMIMVIHVVSLSQTSTRQRWKRGCIASCCTRSFRPAYQHNPDSARIRLFEQGRETTTHLPSVHVLHDLLLPGNSGLLSSEGVSVLLGEQQRDEVDARPGLFAVQLSVR